MARCGMTLRYPVKIVIVHDDTANEEGAVIGDAETLQQAVSLAEQQGFDVRDATDGGTSRFIVNEADGQNFFLVTVYPG